MPAPSAKPLVPLPAKVLTTPTGTYTKSFNEAAVCVPTCTVILPVRPPAGAATVSEVAVAAVTFAAVPLNLTMFSLKTVLKFVPLIVTVVPAVPSVGEKLVMTGGTLEESSSLHELNTSKTVISNAAETRTVIFIKVYWFKISSVRNRFVDRKSIVKF